MERSEEGALEELRATVCKKIGRCILRLQQYELLMKQMLPYIELSGYAQDHKEVRARRQAEVQRKTLGQLIDEFGDSFLNPGESRIQKQVNKEFEQKDPSSPHLQFRVQPQVSEQEYIETKAALAELVELRNDLVHHFMDRFDLFEEMSCQSADKYLDDAYFAIDKHLGDLQRWAELLREARRGFAEFADTPEFENWSKYGIVPGGSIDWPSAHIVHQLVHEERERSVDGWTELSSAIEGIRKRRPDITPKVYGCSSWRHVLHESQLFDIQKYKDADSGIGQTWYRSRSKGI